MTARPMTAVPGRENDHARAKKLPNMNAILGRVVKRIVKKFDPEQIILFGSHARGEAGPDSDVDLLVVMPLEESRRRGKSLEIHAALDDIPVSVDIIVTTPERFAWRKDVIRKEVRRLLPRAALRRPKK